MITYYLKTLLLKIDFSQNYFDNWLNLILNYSKLESKNFELNYSITLIIIILFLNLGCYESL